MKRIARRTAKAVRPATAPTRGPKYVYSFAAGKAEGSSALRHLLGGKGCELAEMTNLGVPVPPGFTITTEAWAAYHAAGGKHPPGLWSQVLAQPRASRGRGGQSARRCRAAAARVGALGGAGVDARHDGHRPQSRPERSDRRGPGALDARTSASPGTATAASSRSSATWCSPSSAGPSTSRWSAPRPRAGRRPTRTCPRRALRALVAEFKQPGAGADGPALSPGPDGAAPPGHQRRVRVLVRQEGGGLPAHPSPARRLGHRGDGDGHGLRQSRRDVGHRACASRAIRRRGERRFFGEFLVNAQGEDVVAGIRTPGAARRPEAAHARRVQAPRRLQGHARAPLPRHAGHRVHGAGGPALHPADALGQAHGGRRGAHRGGDGRARGSSTTRRSRGPARGQGQANRAAAHRAGVAAPAPREDGGSRRHVHGDRARAARDARPPPWARSSSTRRRRWRWRSGRRR